MTPSLLCRAALIYAEHFGWHVFPLKPRTKLPHPRFVRRGHLDATRDPEQIGRWWSADPSAGIGVHCAASGIVVLDVDAYKDDCKFSELEARLGKLPDTPRQLTPRGGMHYVFRDEVGDGYRNPCDGAETKHKGYIVLAPSESEHGAYRWDVGAHLIDTPIAPLADPWLGHLTARWSEQTRERVPVAAVRDLSSYQRGALASARSRILASTESGRHDTAIREVWSLAAPRLGLDLETIRDAILPAFVDVAGESRRREGERFIVQAFHARRARDARAA